MTLKNIKQTSSVTNYQAEFETISIKVTDLSESWITSFFVMGLQYHLRSELLLAQPTSYPQAISLAKLH